jgi:hypothetical protein
MAIYHPIMSWFVPCGMAEDWLIFNLYASFMSLWRTSELESSPMAIRGSNKLALSLLLLGLIEVPG